MSGEKVSVTIPDIMLEQLLEIAQAAGHSLEDVILCSLRAGRPPSLTKVPVPFQGRLITMNKMTDQDLWRVVVNELPVSEEVTSEELKADYPALRRSYAFALLKWRGHPMPQPAELFLD